jgi:exosome complex component RRP4
MSEIKVKDKEVVVPGELLAIGMDYLPSFGTYRNGDKILASKLGVLNVEGKVLKLIPLAGRYVPKRNDIIIGKITEILMSGWRLDTNCAYPAVLPLKDATSEYISKGADLRQYFDLGDHIVTKITQVTSQKLIDVTMKGPGLRKLRGGRIIEVNTHKVPRIIGKQGSMVSLLKKATNCRIIVGQNGIIWIQGQPEDEILAVEAIEKIESESHISGLTERIKAFLEKKSGKKIEG